MAGKYPQKSYAVVVRAIQLEWIFLLCVTKNTGYALTVAKKLLRETFLPLLFFGKSKYLPSIVGISSMMPLKKAGLGYKTGDVSL